MSAAAAVSAVVCQPLAFRISSHLGSAVIAMRNYSPLRKAVLVERAGARATFWHIGGLQGGHSIGIYNLRILRSPPAYRMNTYANRGGRGAQCLLRGSLCPLCSLC